MPTTLQFNTPSGAVNLIDGTNFAAEEWTPSVAGWRRSSMGGVGPFGEIDEEIKVLVTGATAAAVYANVKKINDALLDAERCTRGESVTAVQLSYQPASTLQAAHVVGRTDRDTTSGLGLDATYDAAAQRYWTRVTVGFRRRGWWIQSGSAPANAGAASQPSVFALTFASSSDVAGPVDLYLRPQNTINTWPTGVLLYGSQAGDISIFEAESMASGSPLGWSSVADGTYLARGGSVLRCIPSLPNTATTCNKIAGPSPMYYGVGAVWAAVRNNTTHNATFQMRINLVQTNTGRIISSTPWAVIPPSMNTPTLISLGMLTHSRATAGNVSISVTVSADISADALDIDYIGILQLRDETCGAVPLDGVLTLGMSQSVGTPLQAVFEGDMRVYSRALSYIQSQSDLTTSPLVAKAPLPILAKGNTLYVCYLATHGTNWTFAQDPNSHVAVTMAASGILYPAGIVPK